VVTSLFTAPAVVTVSANATDPDGTVAQVEFFVNGASIGVDATAPYEVNWTSVVGSASFTARSTDNRGATRTSSAVVINIADPNALPYAIETSVNVCNEDSFCLPLNVVDAVSGEV
jgi:chitinase